MKWGNAGVALICALAVAVALALYFWISRPLTVEVGDASQGTLEVHTVDRQISTTVPTLPVAPPQSSALAVFRRSAYSRPVTMEDTLRSSLRDAELGSASAQYRAAVLLRECREAGMSAERLDALPRAGVDEDHLRLLRERIARCSPARDLVGTNIGVASKKWLEAALQQNYPLSTAQRIVTSPTAVPAQTVDDALRAALAAAGDDRILRFEAFSLVLGGMDKRTQANGMEAHETVRSAWTLLHCREYWECDLDATLEYLGKELGPVNLQLALELALQIDAALKAEDYDGARMY